LLDHWADTIYLVYATVDSPAEERTAEADAILIRRQSVDRVTVVYASLATGLLLIALQSTKSCL